MAEDTKTNEKPADETKTSRKPAPKLKHLDRCPANPDRVEQYETDRVNRDHSTTTFVVTRCQDCGAHEVKQK